VRRRCEFVLHSQKWRHDDARLKGQGRRESSTDGVGSNLGTRISIISLAGPLLSVTKKADDQPFLRPLNCLLQRTSQTELHLFADQKLHLPASNKMMKGKPDIE